MWSRVQENLHFRNLSLGALLRYVRLVGGCDQSAAEGCPQRRRELFFPDWLCQDRESARLECLLAPLFVIMGGGEYDGELVPEGSQSYQHLQAVLARHDVIQDQTGHCLLVP